MSVVHWLYCPECGEVLKDQRVDPDNLPWHWKTVTKEGHEQFCGGRYRITWEHGKPPATDLHEPTYSDATGQWHRSQREKLRALNANAKWGVTYQEAGDKVGGARPDLSIHGTGFSFPGQGSRQSTGERDGR